MASRFTVCILAHDIINCIMQCLRVCFKGGRGCMFLTLQNKTTCTEYPHSKENFKHIFPTTYIPYPHSATSLPNTKFIFPKQFFIILCGPSLPERPKARVLALISVMHKLISAVYQQLDCQMHRAEQLLSGQAAWIALPSVNHGKNHSYWATIL
jgi:hypothetical protein